MRPIAVLVSALLMIAVSAEPSPAEGTEPVEGGWKGKTSQGLLVYFGVRDGRVVNTRYHFRWGFAGPSSPGRDGVDAASRYPARAP